MAEPKESPLMEKIVSLCKRRGFIYQSSEIYGGINGFWDYGPLGADLKRNVKELWWNTMTRWRDDVVGLEATIIMSPAIWKASGHVDTFADMMVECPVTNKRFRVDQIEPQSGIIYFFKGAFNMCPEEFGFIGDEKEELEKVIKLKKREEGLEALAKEFSTSSNDGERRLAVYISEFLGLKKGDQTPISVLLPAGKPPEKAYDIAAQFYEKRGVSAPWPLKTHTEKVTADTKHNPENGAQLTPPRPFNLMFKTYVGPVESEDSVAYLRPETAQAIFAQFKNVLETSRQKTPFGIAQMGKAFRNEVTPRNFTFRSREFEQMELEFFIKPDEAVEAIQIAARGAGHEASGSSPAPNASSLVPQSDWGWKEWHKYWVEERIRFYESIGLPRNTLVEYWQKPEELAHYAKACVDILYKFPFSKRDEKGELKGEELEGIAARSDFDLSQHQRFSGKSMTVFDDELKAAWPKLDAAKQAALKERYYQARLKYLSKTARPDETPEQIETQARADAEALAKGYYVPHVIEPSAGVDRLALALICNAYCEDQAPDEKGKMETRVVMRFHPRIAPIKVAVFPLLKNKPELVAKAKEVRDLLRPHMTVFYDEAGAIGRRYRRQDEAGTPFGVTIDFDTLGEKGPELKDTVTLRDRDTMKQDRVKISELLPLLLEKIR
jgi:glycyl-tRNA synthetase